MANLKHVYTVKHVKLHECALLQSYQLHMGPLILVVVGPCTVLTRRSGGRMVEYVISGLYFALMKF